MHDAVIEAVATATPPARWSQRDVYELLAKHYPSYRSPRIEKVFMSAGIDQRCLAVDADSFSPEADADELHAVFAENAYALGLQAGQAGIAVAGLSSGEIDALFVSTSTGYLCPGLSARLFEPLGLRADLPRSDLVGAGCGGALPALLRASDFVKAHPGSAALVVTVEVCSACFFVDETLETVVGNAICADGAAAVVVSSRPDAKGPRLERFASLVEPSLLDKVGFEFVGGKERIVLHKDIRKLAGPLVRAAALRLLEESGLRMEEVHHWIAHTGGKRVLDGIDAALGFERGELDLSRSVLRDFGNMSSPTVLFALERALAWRRPRVGDVGVLFALGPGMVAETALLRW